MKYELGWGTSLFNLCFLLSEAGDGCNRSTASYNVKAAVGTRRAGSCDRRRHLARARAARPGSGARASTPPTSDAVLSPEIDVDVGKFSSVDRPIGCASVSAND
ncbi:hypothetical protein MSG28_011878 [Choristoneura fumiferana]|uniref:Uncharacterized protein n=1 Tax=Choristoneura fumiferana TaxID=7141 RepID=A0ACC0KMP4_CHOFU|nr:hypothetical protein MSG28_011878 [Choristoneura fumiferana]